MKYLNAAIVMALIGACGACTALKSVVLGESTCPEPPEAFGPTPLITCGLPSGEPNIACCAYGQFENGSTSGNLCFHVLCKQDACGEYAFVETVCVDPNPITTEVERTYYRPERKAAYAP